MARVGRPEAVTGRVQGVFFRAWTAEQARDLGVAGWIRNRPDGSVEARLSGEQQPIEQLIARMRRGPPGAQVDHLSETAADPEATERFEVRH